MAPARFLRRPGARFVAFATAIAALAFVARPADSHPTPAQGGTVFQIRDFTSASVVEIVAWNASEPMYGLRTWVRRNGAPDRYHRLWVSVDVPNGRDVSKAQGLNRPLPVTAANDAQNCLEGKCAPASTFGARLPDNQFRAATEDVPVKFLTNSGAEFTVTARRALVTAYLAAVDSVITSLKK